MTFLKGKDYKFYANLAIALLTAVALVFFLLSYTTGYVGIVFGEKNSILILVLQIVILLASLAFTAADVFGKLQKPIVRDIAVLVNTAALILSLLFLLADRVDAIGNCIVAPWDAGHGGEDSCYLSFVSMGCYLVALVLNIVASFFTRKRAE